MARDEKLSQSRKEAATALRKFVPALARPTTQESLTQARGNVFVETDTTSTKSCDANLTQESGGDVIFNIGLGLDQRLTLGQRNMLSDASVGSTCSTSCAPATHSSADDNALAYTLQQLVHENATLRQAFNEASQRMAALEDEKTHFFDQGVFDLLNSVCAQTGAGHSYEDLLGRKQGFRNGGGGGSRNVGQLGSPESLVELSASTAHRAEEEMRSAELSGENAELRRELIYASELGEALEQQQRRVEDRMHSLEQERAWLAERLAKCTVVVHADGVESNCAKVTMAHAQLTEAMGQQRADSGRAIADLDGQTQDLERKLLNTEVHACRLEEENARLQAALGIEPAAGYSIAAATGPQTPLQPLEATNTAPPLGAIDIEDAW